MASKIGLLHVALVHLGIVAVVGEPRVAPYYAHLSASLAGLGC